MQLKKNNKVLGLFIFLVIVIIFISCYLRSKSKEIDSFVDGSIIIGLLLILLVINDQYRKIKKLNKELQLKNKKDFLTNAYNKRYIYEKLYELLSNNSTVTCVMIDIDYFKQFNDNYGHIEGDKVLIDVSELIISIFDEDSVARFGGEEFTVISTLPLKDVIKKIENLMLYLNVLNIQHKYSKTSDRVTLSIGIESRRLLVKEDISILINNADKKLYQSKKNGRNQFTV